MQIKDFKNVKLDLIDIDLKDINPKIIDLILKLIIERKTKGKTYLGITPSIFEIPIVFEKNEIIGDMVYSVRKLDIFKVFLENIMKDYSKKYNIQFENSITVTVSSEDNFVMNTILFNTRKECFMLKIGYPKQKENDIDSNQISKRLIK